jgi:membrane-associated protein
MHWLIDHFLHLDHYLGQISPALVYLFMFLIIFCETGLVVTPFLPGDSILFAAGALAATTGSLNVFLLLIICISAAILGDTVNYWIGHFFGDKLFRKEDAKVLKPEYIVRTHQFYEKHGGKTIILARFVPIIRTVAPFVAGVGEMTYAHFFAYNVIGGAAWVTLFTLLGYFFNNIPFVKNNFSIVIIAIVLISIVPFFIAYFRNKRQQANADPAVPETDSPELAE